MCGPGGRGLKMQERKQAYRVQGTVYVSRKLVEGLGLEQGGEPSQFLS